MSSSDTGKGRPGTGLSMGRKKKQNTGFDSGMEILYNSGVKKLMIYGLDEPLLSRAEAIADELGIMTSIIGDDVLEEKLGSLMEKQEDFPARHCEFDLPYFIVIFLHTFCPFSDTLHSLFGIGKGVLVKSF